MSLTTGQGELFYTVWNTSHVKAHVNLKPGHALQPLPGACWDPREQENMREAAQAPFP